MPLFTIQFFRQGRIRLWRTILLLLLLAGPARAATVTSTGSGNWDAAIWSGGSPADNDVFICSGHTVTITGLTARAVNSLSITGTLTHAANASAEDHKIVLQIGNNLTLAPGGQINVDANGYGAGAGPGTPLWGNSRSGASHGGEGGIYDAGSAGPTYGSITNPVTLGSGGARYQSGSGGKGGGVVVMRVTGDVTHNGVITARGESRAGSSEGGGAGGTISLTARSITGAGSINAGGGNGDTGGGAGGRIALVVTNPGAAIPDTVLTNIAATGGLGTFASRHGAAGTIYLKTPAQKCGDVIVNNNGRASDAGTMTIYTNCTYQFDTVIVTNRGVFAVGANAVLNLNGCTLRSDSTTNGIGSRLVVGRDNGTLTWTGNWTNNGTISWYGTNPMAVTGDLTIAAGGILTHESGETHAIRLNLNGDLTVNNGGAVWVKGAGGYAYTRGDGRGGGGHGGEGGYGWGGGTPSTTYGSVTNPVTQGSSGYDAAGGCVIVRAAGTVTLNGTIVADGNGGGGWSGYGGAGAAGSVNIRAGGLAGNGRISADGGDGGNGGGGGGGGRIAVVLTNSATFGNVAMSAVGGALSSGQNGGAGTIYLQGTNEMYGTLIVSNNRTAANSAATLIGPLVTDAVVGDVRLLAQTKLSIATNCTLAVHGSWSNAVAANAISGGTVSFVGSSPSTVWGANTWSNLVITSAYKTVYFEYGKTQTVYGIPAFSNGATLLSTSKDAWWYLLKPGVGTQDVGKVWVRDSNATNGWTFRAASSGNGGNNVNWLFAPAGCVLILR